MILETKESIFLHYRDARSDKVYQIQLDRADGGYVVNFQFGRRGASLQSGTKTPQPLPFEKACSIYEALIAEKKGKGYTEAETGTPYEGTPQAGKQSGLLPQLLNPIDEAEANRLIAGLDFIMQEKKDGRRLLVRKSGTKVEGVNRKGQFVALPSEVANAVQSFDCDWVLDGESAWYRGLTRIAGSTVFIDDVPVDDWPQGNASRPEKIEIELRMVRHGQEEQKLRLPVLIHVFSSGWNEINFVAMRNSPWDNDNLHGPFSVVDFLTAVLFRASDDSECDSWATQQEYFQAEAEREVNRYFQGPRATLIALLRRAIDWDVNRLAEQLDIQEIRFKRAAAGLHGWEIQLGPTEVAAISTSTERDSHDAS